MADDGGGDAGGARHAPGWPGIAARWTSAGKSGVGTALEGSPLWFTLSHGILNEVYAPRIDEAMTRDLGFLVTGPDGYLSEPKRDAVHRTVQSLAGVPCYQVRSACRDGRYLLESEVWSDPLRLVVLLRVKLNVLKGAGLIVSERRGTTITYSLNLSTFEDAAAALLDLFGRARNGKGPGASALSSSIHVHGTRPR